MAPNPDPDLTEVVSARMQAATVARLSRVAEKMDRPVSWCVRRAVVEWLDRQERKQP